MKECLAVDLAGLYGSINATDPAVTMDMNMSLNTSVEQVSDGNSGTVVEDGNDAGILSKHSGPPLSVALSSSVAVGESVKDDQPAVDNSCTLTSLSAQSLGVTVSSVSAADQNKGISGNRITEPATRRSDINSADNAHSSVEILQSAESVGSANDPLHNAGVCNSMNQHGQSMAITVVSADDMPGMTEAHSGLSMDHTFAIPVQLGEPTVDLQGHMSAGPASDQGSDKMTFDNSTVGSMPGMTVDTQPKIDGMTVLPNSTLENYVLVETSKGLMLSSVSDGGQGVSIANVNVGTITDEQGRQFLTQTLPTALFAPIPALGLGDSQDGGVFGARPEGSSGTAGDSLFDETDTLNCTSDIQLVPQGTVITVNSGQPAKRKKGGGWPKGKKRKIVPEINAPKKPATGYVLYAVERRQHIKMMHPELPFAEVTKVLGQEWSCLAAEKKQKYLDLAEDDKKRYISEMNTFQQSEFYQNLLKKKKLTAAEAGQPVEGDDGLDSLIDLEEGMYDLYCKVCDQYFISVHNKKEHMFGQQHLQNITSEIQKEIQEQLDQNQQALAAAAIVPPDGITVIGEPGSSETADRQTGPVDINGFIQGFIQRNIERQSEIRQLKQSWKVSHEDNIAMCKQVKELQEYESKLEQDLGNLKAYGSSMSAQIDSLKMVPTLFGVINF